MHIRTSNPNKSSKSFLERYLDSLSHLNAVLRYESFFKKIPAPVIPMPDAESDITSLAMPHSMSIQGQNIISDAYSRGIRRAST